MKDRLVPVTAVGCIVLAAVLSTTSAKEPSSGTEASPLEQWIYPDAYPEKKGSARSGDPRLTASGGIFVTEDSFDKVFNFYARKLNVAKDAEIHDTNQGMSWRVWGDAAVKSMVAVDTTEELSHANILGQKPGAFSISISIVRSPDASKTRVAISYLISELERP